MREAVVGTRASMKINAGNYESIEVSKMLEVEIEYETPEELKKKSKALDKCVTSLLQAERDEVLAATGKSPKAPGIAVPAAL